MALVTLCSAKGSPGATTAALALTLTWPQRCLLAECDPAGGSVLAGYLAGALPADRGIAELAVAQLRGAGLEDVWWKQLVDLAPPQRSRLLLPGVTDPEQSGALSPVWARLAAFFVELERADPAVDVIADCGRLAAPNAPWPLLTRADLVLLVLPATLPGLSAATPVLRTLRRHLEPDDPTFSRLGLLARQGEQSTRKVASLLSTPVVAELPEDPRTARILARGGTTGSSAPLMVAAQLAGREITRRTGGQPAAASLGGQRP